MTQTQTHTETTVAAELAPIGIQLWPTRSPNYADNYTLRSVAIVRDDITDANNLPGYVVWTYRNGNTRTFRMGEHVVIKIGE